MDSSFEESMQDYEALPEEERREFVPVATEMPELSGAVESNLRAFPVDQDFRVVSLAIRDTSVPGSLLDFDPELYLDRAYLPPDLDVADLEQSTDAYSQAIYEDKLYGYRIGILIFSLEDAAQAIAEPTRSRSVLGKLSARKRIFLPLTGK